jgi:IS1 family transposase/transposase-like protein
VNDVRPWLVLLVLLGAAGLAWRWGRQVQRCGRVLAGPGAGGPRRWRPRTPDDCPACRAQPPASPPTAPPSSPPPWQERKSRRGAPKRIATAGHACPTRSCPYYGLTDERVHALVGYGHHGATDRIQDFRCQACGTKVSARRGTALYQLKTSPRRIGEVLSAVAEGLDVAAAVRVFGHGKGTVTRWLQRAGQHADRLHERLFRSLHLPHVQLDEIRTRLRARRDVLWVWLALDPLTKIVPAVSLGPRTQAAAHAVVHSLKERLAPACVPIFTSDGLRLYYYALTAHFGHWAEDGRSRRWHVAGALVYGQVRKAYRRRRIVRVTHRVVIGTWGQLRAGLRALGLSGRVNTAFVERVNLTIRRGVPALGRRTWATAQTVPGLRCQLAWWRGYYHFIRPHHALRVVLPTPRHRGGRREPQRYRARTPAMAAGLTTRRWGTRELLSVPCVQATWPGAPPKAQTTTAVPAESTTGVRGQPCQPSRNP